ncbi:MarR family winged helix-turn-helix transcriptional regulator [Pseudomonas fluorescens]|uniref:MarR family winged helix-turn-helix transcriptional regulator n=1 Tax=Pseudomonas fluorescens TaxID=294 RepID=UPI003F9A9B32
MNSELKVGTLKPPNLISKLQTELNQSINAALTEYEIKYPQYRILEILSSNNRLHPSHFSRELSINGSSITRQIDQLVKLNLISRVYDTNDRRRVWIEISQEEKEVANATGESIKACMDVFLKSIQRQDIEHFEKICSSILSEKNST